MASPLRSTRASRRDRKKAERKEQLLAVAMGLFVEHGFEGTTVDEIADAADVSRATFFNHFSSKESVLVEYRARRQRDILTAAAALLEQPRSARQRFDRHFRHFAETVLADADRVRLLTLELAPARRRADQETARRVLALYGRFLRDGIDRGELRPDLDVSVAVQLVAGAWTMTLLGWAQGLDPDPARTITDKLDLIFNGLANAG